MEIKSEQEKTENMLHELYSDFQACENSRENFNYSQWIVNENKQKQRDDKMAAAHSLHPLLYYLPARQAQ